MKNVYHDDIVKNLLAFFKENVSQNVIVAMWLVYT